LRYEWRAYLSHLLATRCVTLLARAVWNDLLMHPRVPLWGSAKQMAGSARHDREWRNIFPDWLADDFSARCACRDRWQARQQTALSRHPVRPIAYQSMGAVEWQSLFDYCDISGALSHSEIRHPFLDLRVLQYMLAVPAMPWCRNKLMIRRSMRARLPDAVLRRRKTSIGVSAEMMRVRASGLPRPVLLPEMARYVKRGKIPTAPTSELELRAALRPLGLNYWLQQNLSQGAERAESPTASVTGRTVTAEAGAKAISHAGTAGVRRPR